MSHLVQPLVVMVVEFKFNFGKNTHAQWKEEESII